jgi:hypothetical protein
LRTFGVATVVVVVVTVVTVDYYCFSILACRFALSIVEEEGRDSFFRSKTTCPF